MRGFRRFRDGGFLFTTLTIRLMKKFYDLFRRNLLLGISVYVMSLGVALFVRSGLGSSAISVTPLVWSLAGNADVSVAGGAFDVPALTIGEYTLLMNFLFVVL